MTGDHSRIDDLWTAGDVDILVGGKVLWSSHMKADLRTALDAHFDTVREPGYDTASAETRRQRSAHVMELEARCERHRMLGLGALAVLAADGVITHSRARELGQMTIKEQRSLLRTLLKEEESDG